MATALSATYRAQLNDFAKRDEWAKSAELCRQLLVGSRTAELYFFLGRSLAHLGSSSAAVEAYAQALVLQPQHPESHYALGVIYADEQAWGLAICHYQHALQQRPHWFEALFRLARAFHRLGESARSLSTYEQVVECNPDCVEAYFSMGLLYAQQGNHRQAIKSYRRAVFARPSYAKAHEYLGAALLGIEAYEAAEVVYQQAIAACPKTATLHIGLGNLHLAQGQTQSALLAYRQAIALNPDLSLPYKKLGSLYYQAQSLPQASAYFQQALERAPSSMNALSDYAWVAAEQGQWLTLLDCFYRACKAQPTFVEAYCQRTRSLGSGDLLFRLQRTCGEFLQALSQTDADPSQLTKRLPQLAQIYYCLGNLSSACDALPRAEQCYRYALALTVDASPLQASLLEDIYEGLSECLRMQGKEAAAIAVDQARNLHSLSSLPDSAVNLEVESPDSTLQLQSQHRSLGPAVTLSGVYRHVQDWLADRQLAPVRLSDEPYVNLDQVTRPDPKCGGLTCQSCMNGLISKFAPVQMGKYTFRCSPAETDETLEFSAFVATIPQGRAWVAPQQNAWAVCNEIAVISPDDFLLGDLSRCYPWYLPGCTRHDVANHTLLQRSTTLPPARQLSGRVVVLSGLSGHIYYHWLFDVLPRFNILQKGLSALSAKSWSLQESFDQVDHFVVNSLSKPFQKETLAALGVPLEKVIESDRTPHIQAEELLVPSFAGHLDWVPPSSMDFLRQAFLPASSSSSKAPARTSPRTNAKALKRIYISRAGAKYRHIFNEEFVINLLSQCGFVVVTLETLTVAQQAQLFSQAEVIIGAHGSGLANLVFCSPGCTVVELFSPYYLRTDYWMISQYLQLHHYYLVGKSFPFQPLRQLMYPSGLTEDFSVDVKAFRSLLRHLNLMP